MSKERVMLRLVDGKFLPADRGSADILRERGYKTGDWLSAELRKPRNPKFHRFAHAFGGLCAENLEAFEGMNCHAVLKRLQIEANVGCDEVALNFPGIGPCVYRVPRSLSFASMDEGEFHTVMRGLSSHVSKTYWPSLTPEQIEAMAEMMVEAA